MPSGSGLGSALSREELHVELGGDVVLGSAAARADPDDVAAGPLGLEGAAEQAGAAADQREIEGALLAVGVLEDDLLIRGLARTEVVVEHARLERHPVGDVVGRPQGLELEAAVAAAHAAEGQPAERAAPERVVVEVAEAVPPHPRRLDGEEERPARREVARDQQGVRLVAASVARLGVAQEHLGAGLRAAHRVVPVEAVEPLRVLPQETVALDVLDERDDLVGSGGALEAVAPGLVRGDVEQGRARAVELDRQHLGELRPRDRARHVVAARDHAEPAAALDELAQGAHELLALRGVGGDVVGVDVAEDDDVVVLEELLARGGHSLEGGEALGALLLELRVGGEQEELHVDALVHPLQLPVQEAVLVARIALHVEHADLLAVDAHGDRDLVVVGDALPLEGSDAQAEAALARAEVHRVTAGDEHDAIAGLDEGHLLARHQAHVLGIAGRDLLEQEGGGAVGPPGGDARGDGDLILEDGLGGVHELDGHVDLGPVVAHQDRVDRDARGPGGGGHLVRGRADVGAAVADEDDVGQVAAAGAREGAADRVADGGGRAARVEARAVGQRRDVVREAQARGT